MPLTRLKASGVAYPPIDTKRLIVRLWRAFAGVFIVLHISDVLELFMDWLPFRNDLRSKLRFNSENTTKKRKNLTKIITEIGITSDRIGSESPVPAFQSRIACGQNPMAEQPSNLFLPPNSPIVNICKYVSAIHLYTVCYKHKMSDGARILAGFARPVRPLHP